MKETYRKITEVLAKAGRPLAPHEFDAITMQYRLGLVNGREYVGQSESAIGRRLREMRELKIVSAKRRDGKAFVEYEMLPVAVSAEPAPVQEMPPCPI